MPRVLLGCISENKNGRITYVYPDGGGLSQTVIIIVAISICEYYLCHVFAFGCGCPKTSSLIFTVHEVSNLKQAVKDRHSLTFLTNVFVI